MPTNISVVVCTRNRPQHLAECVVSLLRQTRKPKEIIVVDDASENDLNLKEFFSRKISKHRRKDGSIIFGKNRVNMIFVKNKTRQGVVKSRNLGISMASGDVIAFIDDDGVAHKEWVGSLKRVYKNKDIVGAGGPVIETRIDPKNNNKTALGRGLSKITKQGDFLVNFHVKKGSDVKKLSRSYVKFLQGSNMSFRKSSLLKVNGFDASFKGNFLREETDLCLRVSKTGKIVFEPSAVTYHNTAKSGGTRDVTSVKDYLYWYFRNSSLLFLRALDMRSAISKIGSQMKKYISQLSDGNMHLFGRDYLVLNSRTKILFSILTGVAVGVIMGIFSDPSIKRLAYHDPQHIFLMSLAFTKDGIKIINKMRLEIGKTIKAYRF